jgi:recombination associated protein RdgC
MFPKSVTVLAITPETDLTKLNEQALEAAPYKPIGATEEESSGWVPAFEDQFLFQYHGFSLLKFAIEKKSVPASAVKKLLNAKIVADEEQRGSKPGRLRRKELKQEAKEELLARAIPSYSEVPVFLDQARRRLLIGTATASAASSIMGALYGASEVQLQSLPKWPGREAVTTWLCLDSDDEDHPMPDLLTADDYALFDCPGETGKTIRFDKANLDDADVQLAIAAGAVLAELAMTWDAKVSFIWKDSEVTLTGVKHLGVLEAAGPDVDAFQNDFYLTSQTLQALVDYLEACA